MRFIGYLQGQAVHIGALRGEGALAPLGEVEAFWRDPYAAVDRGKQSDETLLLDDVTIVPPVLPSARILCVGLNYAAHVSEGPFEVPDYPTVFGRWHASLSVSDVPVEVPVDEAGLDWEAELVAVVGRPLRFVDAAAAAAGVFSYAAFNDITARRAQKLTTQWTIGKNVDGSGPLSPFVTADEIGDLNRGLQVVTRVNGEVMQDGNTKEMLFGIGEVLAFISRTFQLNPGDLVATGTPNGVGYARTPPRLLGDGDVVEVEIQDIGTVRTPIVVPPAH